MNTTVTPETLPASYDDLQTYDTEYVVGFAFTEDMNFVSLLRRTKDDWQKGLMNGLGGHVDEGETPEQAMVREFFEEGDTPTNADQWVHFMDKIGGKDQAMPGLKKSYRVRCYATTVPELPKEREINEA